MLNLLLPFQGLRYRFGGREEVCPGGQVREGAREVGHGQIEREGGGGARVRSRGLPPHFAVDLREMQHDRGDEFRGARGS